jgi:hypothetical protein
MVTRTCLICGRAIPAGWGGRCELHGGGPRKSTVQRGYGWPHRRRRHELLASTPIGSPCPRCGEPMLPGQQLDLDHSPLAPRPGPGDRLAHASCNRARR